MTEHMAMTLSFQNENCIQILGLLHDTSVIKISLPYSFLQHQSSDNQSIARDNNTNYQITIERKRTRSPRGYQMELYNSTQSGVLLV